MCNSDKVFVHEGYHENKQSYKCTYVNVHLKYYHGTFFVLQIPKVQSPSLDSLSALIDISAEQKFISDLR